MYSPLSALTIGENHVSVVDLGFIYFIDAVVITSVGSIIDGEGQRILSAFKVSNVYWQSKLISFNAKGLPLACSRTAKGCNVVTIPYKV